jgi:Ca-activated chloride channel family protein
MYRSVPNGLAFIMILFLCLPLLVSAKVMGGIGGIVYDRGNGGTIAGASIVLDGTNKKTMTAADGRYLIGDITPGKYIVRASAPGYAEAEVSGVNVKSGQDARIDIGLDKHWGKKDESGNIVPRMEKALKSEMNLQYNAIDQSIRVSPVEPFGAPRPPAIPNHGGFPPAHGGITIVNGQSYDAMFFQNYGSNPFVDAEDDHLSTFAVDIDDASYSMTRSYLERGNLPPNEAVRTEEFINHFHYNYEFPSRQPFSVHIEGAPSAFRPNCQLLRIGIQGQKVYSARREAANLVFLVDISGSMGRENRLELVKQALRILVDNLRETDRIGIVAYESSGHIVLEPTTAENKEEILAAIEWLHPMGATNLEEGLRLAYQMAERGSRREHMKRIILCSDGVANIGVTNPDMLLGQIKGYADRGITLTTVGVGMGNYNDVLLEKLGDKGNGQYAYVDDIAAARKIFLFNLTGTLQTIARDVKIQVDFDTNAVRSYRLLGYENRDVADEKFRDDREDGGEIGSGHQVTALYEIKLQKDYETSHIATVNIRYKNPVSHQVAEVDYYITRDDFRDSFEECSTDFKLAAASAQFAEILKKSYWAKSARLDDVQNIVRDLQYDRETPEIVEFMNLVSTAERLQDGISEREYED